MSKYYHVSEDTGDVIVARGEHLFESVPKVGDEINVPAKGKSKRVFRVVKVGEARRSILCKAVD